MDERCVAYERAAISVDAKSDCRMLRQLKGRIDECVVLRKSRTAAAALLIMMTMLMAMGCPVVESVAVTTQIEQRDPAVDCRRCLP